MGEKMIYRALEVIEHARVHASKIFLDSKRTPADARAFRTALEIFNIAYAEVLKEAEDKPLWNLRPPRRFAARWPEAN